MDLFATEGGTAAIEYIFNSLIENKLLNKGDKIAVGVPIFTPYIEILNLNDFEFIRIDIKQDENNNWQYPDEEIKKLLNSKIKAFFLVHPANPTSVAMSSSTLKKLKNIVKNYRPDLLLLTDDVYATFTNKYKSLITILPHNTILIYSYSKYFGVTGMRLGIIAIHKNNIFDKLIKKLSKQNKKILTKRYSSLTINANKLKFIDRIVADSRLVALNHTAGLSTIQQTLMTLFSLYCLIDNKKNYKNNVQKILKKRFSILNQALQIKKSNTLLQTHYYTIINIPKLAAKKYDINFANHLINDFHELDFVIRLAKDKSIVLMDGAGFAAPKMSIRVSLANLPDDKYKKIGESIIEVLNKYYTNWYKINNK